MRRMILFIASTLLLFGVSNPRPVHADDPGPVCTQTYKQNADGSRSIGQPLCTESWALNIWNDYLYNTLSQIKIERIWLQGSYVNRVMQSSRIDQTGKRNVISPDMFAARAEDYGVGADISWGPGDAEDECGFIMNRADSDNYYMLSINQKGQAIFHSKVGGQWRTAQVRSVQGIKAGRGVRNRVMAIQFNERYFLFVNGKLATSFDSQDRKDQTNSPGLAAQTYQNPRGTTFCQFNGAWFWKINKWELKK
jgi:hypothetical protein